MDSLETPPSLLDPRTSTLLPPPRENVDSWASCEVLDGFYERTVEYKGYTGYLSPEASKEKLARLQAEEMVRKDYIRYMAEADIVRYLKPKSKQSKRMKAKHALRRRNKKYLPKKKEWDNTLRGYARIKFHHLRRTGNVLFTKYDFEEWLRSLPLEEGRHLWAKRDYSFKIVVIDTKKDISIDNIRAIYKDRVVK